MAITVDTSTATATGSSGTITSNSHTCTSSFGILFAGITIRDTQTITVAPTYNGVTMTSVGVTAGTSGITNYLYYLVGPSTGTGYAVTATQSGSDNFAIATISFEGVKETGQPDATSAGGPTTTTSYSQSVTSVADNCFSVLWGNATGGAALTGGTNTTIVNQPEATFTGAFLIRSTAAKTPAGTFTLNATSTSQTFAGVMASFSPKTDFTFNADPLIITATLPDPAVTGDANTTLTPLIGTSALPTETHTQEAGKVTNLDKSTESSVTNLDKS